MHVKVVFDDEEFNDIRRTAKELSDLLTEADKCLDSLREKACLFIREEMPAVDAGTSPIAYRAGDCKVESEVNKNANQTL